MAKNWRPGPYPRFTWSLSRDQQLQCERAYYWQYYGSWLGWPKNKLATEEQRTAYRLKNLTGLHQAAGAEVHKNAEAIALALRDQREERPTADDIEANVRRALNRVCTTPVEAFLTDPKRYPIPHSRYYRGSLDPGEVKAVKEKLRPCAENLADHAFWNWVENLNPTEILAVEELACFEFEGTPVWVKLDFAAHVPAVGDLVIVDWKTSRDDESPVKRQLALYALYVRDGLRVPWEDGYWEARAINLCTGMIRRYELTRRDLIETENYIRASIARMRELLQDELSNEPLPREHFPLAAAELRWRCPRCPFFELCETELNPVARERKAEAVQFDAPVWDQECYGTAEADGDHLP